MSIWTEVLAFIENPDPQSFDSLALRVFRHQFASVPAYRSYCRERRVEPEAVGSVWEIPAVSTAAFKHAELVGGRAERVFLTSGTARGPAERGRHFVPHLGIYRASAVAHLRRMLFPDGSKTRMLALHPSAERMPESSLAQMISWCIEEFGNGHTLWAASRERVAIAEAREFLLDSASAAEPLSILGTTAAIAAMLSSLRETGTAIRLAAGSRIMDTGGSKGQTTPISAEALLAEAHRWLGIVASMVVNEYGMTEMCSQLFDLTAFNRSGEQSGSRPSASAGEVRAKMGPPWLRAWAVDPVTLDRMPEGRTGLLSFFDLANVGSVSALITEDFGAVDGDAIYVFGRAAGEARGCALSIAEFATPQELRRPAALER